MRGIRFYADLPGTSEDNAKPLLPLRSTVRDLREYAALGGKLNCVALLLGDEHRCYDGTHEAIVATFWHPDSDTSLGSIHRDVLRKCRRIPESVARLLHPRLMQRLNTD